MEVGILCMHVDMLCMFNVCMLCMNVMVSCTVLVKVVILIRVLAHGYTVYVCLLQGSVKQKEQNIKPHPRIVFHR